MSRHFAAAIAACWLVWAPLAHAEVVIPHIPRGVVVDAEQRAVAVAAYQRAAEAYEKLQLELALTEADRAYRVLPNASTALIRATILGEMGRHAAAFAACLQAADLEPTAEERQLIDAGLAQHGAAASPPFGWLRVASEPAKAQVLIDGQPFDAPRTVGLSAGSHTLRVEAPGHVAEERQISVEAGMGQAQTVALRALPTPAAPTVLQPAEPPRSGRAGAWVLIGAGGAALVASAVLLASGQSRLDAHAAYASGQSGADLDDAERRARADSALEQARRQSYAGYGVLTAALISAGLGTWIAVKGRPKAGEGTVTVGASVRRGESIVMIGGGF